jgi:hypothetical protein
MHKLNELGVAAGIFVEEANALGRGWWLVN